MAVLQDSAALLGVMLVGGLVCAVAQTRVHTFAQSDLLVLCNFITSSESFLQSSESFTPVCMPAFNPAAFLHAYVNFLHKVCGCYLFQMWLTNSPEKNSCLAQMGFIRFGVTAQLVKLLPHSPRCTADDLRTLHRN